MNRYAWLEETNDIKTDIADCSGDEVMKLGMPNESKALHNALQVG
jgi:hypothetical protein